MNVRVLRGRGSLRLILGITALAFALAGCAHDVARAGTGSRPATSTHSFSAYDSTGQPVVRVATRATGSCWTNSVAAPAPDTFRCFAGNSILDPCFASPSSATSKQVVCLSAPWSAAEVLTLTAPLPKPDPLAPARAWAFQLDNGARCVASTGTVPQVQGINLGYHCTDGHDAALRDGTAPTVTADYGDVKSQAVQTVTVTRIWRG